MRTRLFALLAAGLVISVLVASCGKPSEPTSSTPTPATAKAPATAAAGDTSAAKGMRIALVPKGAEHVFWQTVIAGAKAAADEVGATLDVKAPDSETNVEQQIQIIESFTTKGVDAIVMAACDRTGLNAYLKAAKDKGIIISVIDSGISEPELAVTYAATDNVLGGKRAAEKLAELVGDQGSVAVIPFIQGAQSSDEREKGFTDEIAKHANITLLPPLYSKSQVEEAVKVTENLLSAHSELKGIFAANEPGAKGAAQVLKQQGLQGKVTLVGFDAAKDEVQDLKDGVIQALVIQDPFKMGYEGVKAAIDTKLGKPVEKRIDTGVIVVTPDNLNDPDVKKVLDSQVG